MSDKAPETEEIFQTPSLDEFLIDEGQHAMGEIVKYKDPINDGQKGLKEKFSEKFKQIDEARKALAEGDDGPGIAILKGEIDTLKENVAFNDKNGRDDETAKGMKTMLSLYQVLLHDLENPVEYIQ